MRDVTLCVLVLVALSGRSSAQDTPVESADETRDAPEGATVETVDGVVEEAEEVDVEEPRSLLGVAWEHRFSNGLHLVGREDAGHERSALCVSYAAGSSYDPHGLEGLAMLTQRLHDNGITPRFPNGIRTSFPHTLSTLYRDSALLCIQVPDAELERAIHAESARMSYLLHSLTAEHMRAEQERLIQQGWHQSLLPAVERALHGPFRQSATREGLQAIELQHVQRFHQRRYAPSGAVVAIVSKRPRAEVLALAQRYFGNAPGSATTPRPPVQRQVITPTRSTRIALRGPAPRSVSLYWRSPLHLADGDAALYLVAAHLERTLRQELGADARTVFARQIIGSERAAFFVQVGAADEVGLDALAIRMKHAVREVWTTPLSEDALQAARNALLLRSPAPQDRAASLATNSRRFGSLFTHEMDAERLDLLCADDVRQAAHDSLRRLGVTVISEYSRRRRPPVIEGAL